MGFHKIIEIVNSYWSAQALMVANEYDFFTHLEPKGKTAPALSKAIKINQDAAERLLGVLVSLKLIRKAGKVFSNTSLSRKYLVKGKKDYRGEILRHYQDLWNSWCNLSKAVKHGFSDDFLKNKKFLQDKSKIRAFIYGLNNVGLESAKHVAERIALKSVKSMLDIGGGGGIFSIATVNKNPDIKVTIFDLPQILKVTQEIIKENKKEKSISVVPGNFNQDVLPGKYDLILMSKVTHIEDKEMNTKLFKKCFKSLNQGGRIAIHDFMYNDQHTGPLFSSLFSLNMLVRTPRGSVYSTEEYKIWLKKAGFKKFKTYSIPTQTKLLIASK